MVKTLRNVLRNFLDHYEKLEESLRSSRASVKEMAESGRTTPPKLSLYAQEFLELKELTESLKNDVNCPMIEGHSEVNKKKNRYKDILPYDNSRVILSEYPGVPGSDYINANYVRGSSGNQRAYIASQGPLPNTLVDFWRMIWETEILVIVMACNEREAGKYKCEPYWPTNTDEKQQYGNITVEHVKWRQVCPDFLVRTFKVSADNEERTICQFHYTTWPDHGVPSSVQPILELVRLMRDVQSSESRPILVHCSAGCGRTGTLCSIDYVWALLRTGKLRDDFSLFDIISDMRRQRIAMVQTVEQYMLCYKAVATLFEQHLKLIDSHTYENVDDDGEPLGIKDLTTQEESSASSESLSTTNEFCRNQLNSASAVSNTENSDSESSINNSVDLNESLNQTDLCDEIKPHEKLIGKATVIRRPSISKLKAIFDNPDTNNNQSSITTRTNRLQRSQSIKENFRNFNFNFHLEINQPKNPNRKSKSYTLSAAKLSVYKKNVSFANLVLNQEKNSNGRTKVTDINFNSKNDANVSSISENTNATNNIESPMEKSSSEVHLLNKSKELNHPPVISNTCLNQNVRFNSRPPSLNESTRSAPPKPPRTYQHVVDDSCIIKTSEGRLIVTVAQPRLKNNAEVQNNSNQPESIYEQLGARKYSYQSSPNLAITDRISYFPTGHSSSFHVPQQQINYRDNYGNSNVIYNQMLTKSFPISMYPPINANQPPKNNPLTFRPNEYSINDNYSPFINVLSNQHFQNHQAKPIVLQHAGYYEPIYGTTNHNQFINHQSSSNIQIIQPLNRSKSIINRIPNQITESIYSNREMCYNDSHVAFDNAMPMPVKENIYSEIQNTPKNTAEQNEINQQNKDNIKNGSRFNKFCKAFKIFRNWKGSPNVSTYSKSNNINQSNNNIPANNSGTIVNVPVSNSLKIPNGVAINPINGQPLSRPPHSHRFQSATQWTQV